MIVFLIKFVLCAIAKGIFKLEYESNYSFSSDSFKEIYKVFFQEWLPVLAKKKVLDVGCGSGEFLGLLGSGSLGIDIATENLKAAKDKKLNVRKIDLNNIIPLEEKFEACLLSHVLEHIENPVNLLKFCHSYLESDGEIYICLPIEGSLMSLRHPYFDGRGTHLYAFSLRNIEELLLTTGFELEAVKFEFQTNFTNKLRINKLLTLCDFFPVFCKTKNCLVLLGKSKKNTVIH